jgi:predicted alpha/beta hydrolase
MSMDQSFLDRGTDRLGLQRYPEPDHRDEPDAPVVIIWPAMGVPARFYRTLASALGDEGLAVVVADLRGTGASTPAPSRASRYGYADLVDDVGAVLDALKPRIDGRTTVLLGHSLGGQTCALHLALTHDERVHGLALVAVGLPWYRAYPNLRSIGVLGYTQWINTISALAGVWPGWGFGGRQARGVIRDWAYTARHGRYPRLRGTDSEAALRTVRTPILAISVERDQFTPPSTMDALCAKMPDAPLERVHLSVEETGPGIDHFTWVKSPLPVAIRVAAMARRL